VSVTVARRLTESLGRPHAADAGRLKAPDRRCVTRPRFVDSWRKTIGPAGSQSASMPIPGGHPMVLVFLVKIDALIRAHSSHRVLTEDDWNAVAQLRSPVGRRGAIASRILLRLGLSQAVERKVAPVSWEFRRTSHGRPTLAEGFPEIHFSVSHTDDVALVAVSTERNLGVDVEPVDQELDADVISDFCHFKESTRLQDFPPHKKTREFLRLWTQKEAYSKLVGLGHSIEFSKIDCLSDSPQSSVPVEHLREALCEGFYLTFGHSLYYASLAIQRFGLGRDPIDLRLFDVLGPDVLERDGASDPSFL
jgi:phosphopantetheinyl transferase